MDWHPKDLLRWKSAEVEIPKTPCGSCPVPNMLQWQLDGIPRRL